MKRLFLTLILAAGFYAIASAQTSLVGRVYHHPNIMAEEMKNKQKEIDSKIDETVREEVAKAEKKKRLRSSRKPRRLARWPKPS